MVWQNTTEVGCATAYVGSDAAGMVYYVVCNYAPPGNYEGEPAYDAANRVAPRARIPGEWVESEAKWKLPSEGNEDPEKSPEDEAQGETASKEVSGRSYDSVVEPPSSCDWKPFRDAKTDLWGYKDSSGEVMVEAEYLSVRAFDRNNLGALEDSEGDWNYVDCDGDTMNTYDIWPAGGKPGPDRFSDGLVRTVENDRFGYLNYHGNFVIPPVFDHAEPFCRGIARVSEDCTVHRDARQMQCRNHYYIDVSGRRIATPKTAPRCGR